MNYLTTSDLLPPLHSGFRPGHYRICRFTRAVRCHLSSRPWRLCCVGFARPVCSFRHGGLQHTPTAPADKLQDKKFDSAVVSVVPSWSNSRVRRGATISSAVHRVCGVPQGSVIGPILFVLYTADLIALVKSYGLSPHLYADHTQIYGSCSPSHVDMFLSVVTDCVNTVVDRMRSNRLQLNSDRTEFIWCATVRRQHSLPTVGTLIGSSTVTPYSAVRDLGVYIDSGLTMQSHVRQTVSRCFAVLRQLRTVRRQVPTSVFQSLIVALVLSRLDYSNFVLIGLPANLMQRLQSVQNAAAWLIFKIRRSQHIHPALISLH